MKKVSLLLAVYVIVLSLSSCEPAHPGGGYIAPTTNNVNDNEGLVVQQGEPAKKDSSIEKALMQQKNKDTVQKK